MPRELVVLGTASQAPTRRRNHNGYLLRWDDQTLLFDPGEGTQRQLVLAGLSAASIDRICLTHAHGDHTLGLPGVLARRELDLAGNPAAPVVLHFPVAASPDVAVLRRAGAPWGPLPAVEQPVDPARADDAGLVTVARHDSWTLQAAALDHTVPAVGYRLTERPRRTMLPDLLERAGIRGPAVSELIATGSLRVGGRTVRLEDVSRPRPGQVFALIMDTRQTPSLRTLAEGADLLVIESTFLAADEDLADGYGHLTAAQAGRLARQAGVRRLLLTHFSRRYGDDASPFVAQAAAELGPGGDVVGAEDTMRVAVPPRVDAVPGDADPAMDTPSTDAGRGPLPEGTKGPARGG
jgi:ribonuclease Z